MKEKRFPVVSLAVLIIVWGACLGADWIAPYDGSFMDSQAISLAPTWSHIMGTDTLGRDLFTLILYGGQASIYIGILSAAISTAIGVVYGTISGIAAEWIDDLMMRGVELFMSIPSILLILFLQALWGTASCLSLAVVIGVTSWQNIAKVVRSEVRQIGKSEYILAARTMDAGFGYILIRHLIPNFVSSIMFMVVTNVGKAMITESTLSFLGLGLPLTTISWGSLISMSQDALLTGYWWIIAIPGSILIITLVCITQLGEYVRKRNNRMYSNL